MIEAAEELIVVDRVAAIEGTGVTEGVNKNGISYDAVSEYLLYYGLSVHCYPIF